MPYEDEEQELTLLDIFNILWKRRGLIFLLTFLFAVGSTIYAFTRPFIYRAECRILPPGGNTSGGGLMSELGGLAGFMGIATPSTSGQRMLGIIKGDTVVDVIIDRFNLMEEDAIRLHTRQSVLAKLEAEIDRSSGIVSIAYLDTDPQTAADIANAFVEQLQIKLRELSVLEVQEKRVFFEEQLRQAQQQLSEAENAMMKYQQDSGVLALGAQTTSLLTSITNLRSQIAAKNVEISSLSSYARRDNPRLKLAQSQLDAMMKELHRLETEQQRTERQHGRIISGDILSSIYSLGSVPELGLEYMRYERELKFATVKYETMLRQYENAKLTEASDFSTVQIIDPATPPDWKYKPKRAQIMVIGTMLGFALGVFWAFITAHIRAEREARDYYEE